MGNTERGDQDRLLHLHVHHAAVLGPGDAEHAPGREELTKGTGNVAWSAKCNSKWCHLYREGCLVRMLQEEGWRLLSPAGSQGHLQSGANATGAVL